MQGEMQLMKLNLIFVVVMCKMNIDKVTNKKDEIQKYLNICACTHTGTHTHASYHEKQSF